MICRFGSDCGSLPSGHGINWPYAGVAKWVRYCMPQVQGEAGLENQTRAGLGSAPHQPEESHAGLISPPSTQLTIAECPKLGDYPSQHNNWEEAVYTTLTLTITVNMEKYFEIVCIF